MEPQQQNQQANDQQDGGGSSGKGGFSSSSRQSSTRWTPTSDQIRILKELYYNNGIRSPSAEQIQRISARLRQYGKIEGKNVFYWFQNHKARERQKKRFTSSSDHLPMQRNAANASATNWKPAEEPPLHINKYSNINNIPSTGLSSASSSSAEMVTVGHQMGNYGYGSVPMEKSFRDCSISTGCSSGINHHHHHHHLGWVGHHHHVDPYSSAAYANLFDRIRPTDQEPQQQQEDDDDDDDDDDDNDNDNDSPEIETLPLFPMHGEDIHGGYCNLKANNAGSWYHHQAEDLHHGFINGSRTATSLELTLNSYTRRSPDHYA